jgi:hypothetical protein
MESPSTVYALQLRSSSRTNEERAGPNVFYSIPVPGTENEFKNVIFASFDDAKSRVPEFLIHIQVEYGDFETNNYLADDEMSKKGMQKIIELEFDDFHAWITVVEFNISQTLVKPATST